jgi:putative hemolysin
MIPINRSGYLDLGLDEFSYLIFFLTNILLILFSSLEIAISSLNEVTLKQLIEKKRPQKLNKIETVLQGKYIAIISLGIVIIWLLIFLALFLNYYLISKKVFLPPVTSFVLVVLASYFFAYIIPRAIVYINPEKLFLLLWPAIMPVYYLFYPLTFPLAQLINRFEKKRKELLSKLDEEIVDEHFQAFLDAGEREGLIEKDEGKMIQSVVDFGDMIVREVMTPRIDMVCISANSTLKELKELVAQTKHSRIPVYKKHIDHIEGVAYSKALLDYEQKDYAKTKVSSVMHSAHFVPESKKLNELLTEMQQERIQLAIVVDEYGGTAGLITIEDILEEIVGEIRDEYDKETEEIIEEKDGSLIVSGKVNIEEIEDALDLELDEATFETVGGLVFEVLGYFPKVGENFEHKGAKFQILEADDRRIYKVKIKKL